MPNDPAIYHTRILKGGALFDDMRLLARSWSEQAASEHASVSRALLGKKTLARSKDVFTYVFAPRFLHGDPPDAWRIVRYLEDRDAEVENLRPVYYWVTVRSDRLLYDYATKELVHATRIGRGSVRIEETATWIRNQLVFTGQEWSPTVILKVGRGLLATLRDFRILEGAVRKRVAPVHLAIESFCYIAFCLWQLGASGAALVDHADWGLFLLTPALVERLLLEAHQHGFLGFHSAGRIHRIDFPATNHEEYADVLFGAKP
jgi:hypothetical protein